MAPRRLLVAAGVAGVLLLFLQLRSSDTAREHLHHELRLLRHQLQDAEEHLRVTERQLRAAEARPNPKCPACEHARSVESIHSKRPRAGGGRGRREAELHSLPTCTRRVGRMCERVSEQGFGARALA